MAKEWNTQQVGSKSANAKHPGNSWASLRFYVAGGRDMDLVDLINLALKVMTLTGLASGLGYISLQLLIRKLERQ